MPLHLIMGWSKSLNMYFQSHDIWHIFYSVLLYGKIVFKLAIVLFHPLLSTTASIDLLIRIPPRTDPPCGTKTLLQCCYWLISSYPRNISSISFLTYFIAIIGRDTLNFSLPYCLPLPLPSLPLPSLPLPLPLVAKEAHAPLLFWKNCCLFSHILQLLWTCIFRVFFAF